MKINSETSHYRDVDFDSDIPEATIIPFPQKIKSEDQGAPPPEQTVDIGREDSAYHFDYDAINLHVKMLFELAGGIPGKFVVLALTGDKTDPPYEIAHFRADGGPNEVERMAAHIRSFCPSFGIHPDHKVREPWVKPDGKIKTWPKDYRCKPLNIYVPWALFHADLEKWKKGAESDVIASLAGIVDLDCDKGDSPDLPLKASGRLTTSPGNYQDFFVYPQPLTLAEAKPVVLALHRMTFKVQIRTQ
jgi:hypothetical protein